jgi:predicted DNA-binding transcriptional regulator YafY
MLVHMKADRLLSALLLLQAHGRLSSRELADRLEVCVRTVHRDMEALSASGVPVLALRGARGGWQLDEQWRTRVPGLEEAELRALLMVQPRAVGHPRLAATAERALTKLIAAMPPPLRRRAATIQARLYIDPTGWRGSVEDLSALPTVQDAVGLVAKGTTWYLVANTRDGFRTYRVSRIKEATMLDSGFERPPNFDLAAFWKSSTEEFRQKRCYVTTLRVERGSVAGVRMWCRVVSGEPPGAPDRPGWVSMRVQFDDESEACFVVLGLGARIEVVAPESLRKRVAREIAAMFARQAEDEWRGGARGCSSSFPFPRARADGSA